MDSKIIFSAIVGFVGAIISEMLGGFDIYVKILMVFIFIDIASGVLLSFRGRSDKTESGFFSSAALYNGLIKRCYYFVLIFVVVCLEMIIGVHFLRDAVIWFFVAYEGSSIVEHAARAGVPVPDVILNALDIVKSRADTTAVSIKKQGKQ